MKKVKTIITALIIIFATAFVSACSCGQSDPEDIIQVYETGISITSDFDGAEVDPENGFMTIRCHRGEEFTITYTLTPSNATTTQVDWDFTTNDDVVESKRNYYSYSQAISHSVTFVARKVGNTVLRFTTKATGKWTEATIIVGDAPEVLPTFVAPTNLNYNPSLGKLTWDPVTTQKLYTGEVVDCPKNNGVVVGLTGYEVIAKNLTTGETIQEFVTKNEFDGLVRGNTYSVSVVAKGDDNFTVKDSPKSSEFLYHQLASAENLQNNNGVITFNTPMYSSENRVYFNVSDNSQYVSRTIDSSVSSQLCSFRTDETFEVLAPNLMEYNIYVVSYPEGYANAEKQGLNYVLDVNTKVRYYASIPTNTLVVQKLETPIVSLSYKTDTLTVGGVTFGENTDNKPHISSIISWKVNTQYEQSTYVIKYAYAIFKNDTKIYPSQNDYEITEKQSFDTSQLWKYGADKYKIVVYTIGNSSNTVASKVVEFGFNIIGPMDKESTSIVDNILTTSIASSTIGGVDLFFVNTDNNQNSKHVFVSGSGTSQQLQIDLTNLELQPGSYDIYGRFVGVNGQGDGLNATTATGEITKINNSSVVVAKPVTGTNELSNLGVIKFKEVNSVSEIENKNYNTYEIIVNKGGSSSASAVVSIKTADYSHNYNDIRYTQTKESDGYYNFVSIYDIIGKYLLSNIGSVNNDNVESEILDFTRSGEFNYQIICKGDAQNGVDSAPTSAVRFQRTQAVSSLDLQNYVLSFESVGSSITYELEFNGHKTTIGSKVGSISVDLKTTIVDGKSFAEHIAEYIANDASETESNILIKVSAIGTTADSNSPGFLNSVTTEVYFNITEKPSSMTIDQNSNLTWSMKASDSTNKDFLLKFYKYTVNEVTERTYLTERKINVEKVVYGEENIDTDSSTDEYTYNINSIINEIYGVNGNIIVGVTIEEVASDKFTGGVTEDFYVVKLPEVEMSRNLNDDNVPVIEFDKLTYTDGIKYNILVIKDGNEETIRNNECILTDELGQYNLSSLGISTVGSYELRMIASKDTTNTNSYDNPYVISSDATTMLIKILSSQITVTADGEIVKWNSIDDNATYTLYYKVAGTEDYVVASNEGKNIVFDKNNLTYNVFGLFVAGTNYIKVSPSIDFVNTGCVISSDDLSVNEIIKLQPVSDIKTENGQLTFTITDEFLKAIINNSTQNEGQLTGEETTKVVVSIILSVDDKVISSDAYTMVYDSEKGAYYVSINNSNYVGTHNYSIQICATGYINSAKSESYSATKLTHDISVAKTGEWIEWNADDNATKYVLQFAFVGGGDPTQINFEYNSADHTVAYEKIGEGNSVEWTQDSNIVKVEQVDGVYKIKYKFDETKVINGVAGDYNYTITPKTNKDGYLNGNKSDVKTITKLGNQVTLGSNYDSISIGGYQEGTLIPQSVNITVVKFENVEEPIEDGNPDAGTQVVKQYSDTMTYTSSIAYSSIQSSITSAETPYLLNLNDVGLTESGSYEIRIQFIGDGNSLLNSEILINDNTFVKLDTTTPYTKNGVIAWSNVDSASSYSIKLNDGEKDVVINDLTVEADTTDATGNTLLLTEEIIKAKSLELNGEEFTFEIGTNYTLQLMSNGSSLSSKWSEPFVIKKLQAPTDLKIISTNEEITYTYTNSEGIEETITVNVGDPMLVWKNPNNVTARLNYLLDYGDGSEPIIVYNTASDTSELLGQLLPKDKDVGRYTLKLKVIGNSTAGTDKIGLLTSNYSGEDIVIPNEPDGETVTNNTNPVANYVYDTSNVGYSAVTEGSSFNQYSWDPVTGAYGYKLSFYAGFKQGKPGGNPVAVAYTTTTTYNFRNTEFDGYGYFTVVVNALTDPAKAIVTTKIFEEGSEPYINYNALYRSPSVANLMVKDGMVSWSLQVSDIKSFVEPHLLISEGTLKTQVTGDDTQQLAENTIKYILNKINNKATGNEDVDNILSSLYTYRLLINGVEVSSIIPSTADVVRIVDMESEKTYQVIDSSYQDNDYLMFKYDLSIDPEIPEDDGQSSEDGSQPSEDGNTNTAGIEYAPGKYTIKVSSQGNALSGDMTIGLISTADGRYSGELVAYKPNTPKTWVSTDDETQTVINQIKDGNLMWSLVTTDDSTLENFDYHKNYKITAISYKSPDSRVSVNVNVDDTFVEEEQSNPNLKDGNNYFRHIKQLFTTGSGTNRVSANTNYYLEINVLGTEDSTILQEDEKAYLNSNVFKYSEPMNILANQTFEVSESKFKWEPCLYSTSTNVVIYGPFVDEFGSPVYAPQPDQYVGKENSIAYTKDYESWVNGGSQGVAPNPEIYDGGIESQAYLTALTNWKNTLKDLGYTEQITQNDTTIDVIKSEFKEVLNFPVELVGEGEDVTINRTTEYSLTKGILSDVDYPAGSYIIRKQEIGNGKGIVDTDFSDKLFVASEGPLEPYGVVATKLGTTSATADAWVVDGVFKWQVVPYANAYRITIDAINSQGEVIDSSSSEIIRDTMYDMPSDVRFNNDLCTYRIRITALRVNDDNTLTHNYFSGDEVATSSYGRATIPQNITITGDGMVTWDQNTTSDSVDRYLIRVNANDTDLNPVTVSKGEKSYDLGSISQNGTIFFYVKSLGSISEDGIYLNSSYSEGVQVTKLATPVATVKDGIFTWGTESTETSGQNLTNTLFVLDFGNNEIFNAGEDGLDLNITNYPLFTDINTYDQKYSLTEEEFKTGEYTFKIKYKGDEGETSGGGNFNITSGQIELKATKLDAPILENVDIDPSDSTGLGNRIRWNKIDNASGYRVKVFTLLGSGDNAVEKVFEKTTFDDIDGRYFDVTDAIYVDLNISEIMNSLFDNTSLAQGLTLKVYVQAIGTQDSTGMSENIYLSSSYSDVKTVNYPSSPTGHSYDSEKGIVTWTLDQNNIDNNNNVLLTMSYNVENVTEDEFNSYWKVTSDSYKNVSEDTIQTTDNAKENRYSEITSRHIEYTINSVEGDESSYNLYNIVVSDTVFLKSNGNGTPTSYQLTNYGTKYAFSIVVTVGDENYNGIYVSQPYEFSQIDNVDINFTAFSGGDGSELLPYKVDSETELNRIRYFVDKHFEIIDNIALTNKNADNNLQSIYSWNIIEDTFTGSIQGNGYTISNIRSLAYSSSNEVYLGFMKENAGTISKLNLDINYELNGGNFVGMNIKVAGLAIINSGTIDNVAVNTSSQGNIYISTGITNGIQLAGIAVENAGNIQNSSVVTGQNSSSQTYGFYALDDSIYSSYVAGIANTNTGIIENTFFSGDITSNYVSGITNTNSGTIDRCYSQGNAYVTDRNATGTEGQEKGCVYGGIAGEISGNSTISNSYSLTKVILTKQSVEKTAYVGGLVGFVGETDNSTISNCYVVVNFYFAEQTTSSQNVKAYYFMPSDSKTTCTNNYYLVESAGEDAITAGTQTISGVTNVPNIESLRSSLSELTDIHGKKIYDTTTEYPTLIKY